MGFFEGDIGHMFFGYRDLLPSTKHKICDSPQAVFLFSMFQPYLGWLVEIKTLLRNGVVQSKRGLIQHIYIIIYITIYTDESIVYVHYIYFHDYQWFTITNHDFFPYVFPMKSLKFTGSPVRSTSARSRSTKWSSSGTATRLPRNCGDGGSSFEQGGISTRES